MKAIKTYNYKGWLGVELDKADLVGANLCGASWAPNYAIEHVHSRLVHQERSVEDLFIERSP